MNSIRKVSLGADFSSYQSPRFINEDDFQKLSLDHKNANLLPNNVCMDDLVLPNFPETPKNDKSRIISSKLHHRRNSIPSTPKDGYSFPIFFDSPSEQSRRNSLKDQWKSLSDDLLVPELDSNIPTSEFFNKDLCSHLVNDEFPRSLFMNNRRNRSKQSSTKSGSSHLSKECIRSEKNHNKTLFMSSFSRTKVLARNLDTPVNSINRILMPVFPVSE